MIRLAQKGFVNHKEYCLPKNITFNYISLILLVQLDIINHQGILGILFMIACAEILFPLLLLIKGVNARH
jgi:hypothetical protein